LRKNEIGALLSAITFHDTEGMFHSVGYAKPLGYGKIQVVSQIAGLKYTRGEYIKSFELLMRNDRIDWEIIELLSMADENSNANIEQVYPVLKDFQVMKDSGEYLQNHTLLSKNKTMFSFKSNMEELELFQKEKDEKKQKEEELKFEELNKIEENKERKQEELDRPYNNLIKEADALYVEKYWNQAKEKYEEAIQIKPEDEYSKRQKNICVDKLQKDALSLDKLSNYDEFNGDSRKVIQEYFKANMENISDDDLSLLKEFIFNCTNNLSGKKLNKFLNFKKDPWKFLIANCVDKETAQNWYTQLKN
jgi:hypothetical protein